MRVESSVTRHHPATPSSSGVFVALTGVVMFSLTAPMTKLSLDGTSVAFSAAGRAVIAGVVAAIVLVVARAPAPRRAVRHHLVIASAGAALGFPLLNAWGLQHVPTSHGAIVVALLPLATAGVSAAITGERPSSSYWICSAVGLAAVMAFVVHEGGGSVSSGDLLLGAAVLAAAFSYAHGAVASRELPGWQVICWAVVIALPVTIPVSLVGLGGAGTPDALSQWGAFLYTAIGSQLVGFFFWYRGLATAGIARAGQTQLIQPMLSLLWAWPIVGEPLTAAAMVTAVVVVGAVAAGRRTKIVERPSVTGMHGWEQTAGV